MSAWTVWGIEEEPLASGLSESGARDALRRLETAGRDDVYAESEEGDVLETSNQ
jgi:hypothetical protein